MQGSYKMDIIASGISEALVTTQAGLLIAIPALAFSIYLKEKERIGYNALTDWKVLPSDKSI